MPKKLGEKTVFCVIFLKKKIKIVKKSKNKIKLKIIKFYFLKQHYLFTCFLLFLAFFYGQKIKACYLFTLCNLFT